jgi:hypothetical protein
MNRALIVLVACSFAAGASAQNLKPGLWEISNTMKSAGGEMEKAAAEMQAQMADMPPEQRAMMEGMMAKQGMKMGAGAPGAMSVKTCLSPEMVERNEFPAQQGNCKSTSQPRAGNVVKMSFTCSDPASSGEGVYTFVSPEAFTSKLVIRSAAQGKAETMNMDGKGKWLASDCGSVAPLRAPAAK